jgi:hypothetical protein
MTPGTAREEPQPGEGCAGLRRRMDSRLGRLDALMDDLAADPRRADVTRRVTQLAAAFREARAELAGHVFTEAFTAAADAQDAARDTGRHRAPARLGKVVQLRPRLAHGITPAAVLAAIGGHGVRHTVSAHLKVGLTAAAAAGVTAAGVTYTVQTAPYRAAIPAAPARIAPAAATPASPPSVITLHPPEPKGKHHRAMSQQPQQYPALASPPPPQAAPPPAQQQQAGTLDVQAVTVTLHRSARDPGTLTAEITAMAVGGPVHWWASPGAGLALDDYAGILADGQTVTVTVSVSAASVLPGQSWTVTLQPGDQPLAVTVALPGLP